VHGFNARNDDSGTSKRLEPQHRSGDSFEGPVIRLDEVVQVFVLTHQDIDASVSLYAFSGRRVGATLVDRDLLWDVVQVDDALQKASGRSHIPLASEKEVHRLALTINGAVMAFPLASHFDIGLIHPPAQANWSSASPENGSQHRQHLDSPVMHGGVVNKDTALLHHFLNVAQA
jgi:hypothetical protein